MAVALARAGMKVAVCARRAERLEALLAVRHTLKAVFAHVMKSTRGETPVELDVFGPESTIG